jgi:hypothetical protein
MVKEVLNTKYNIADPLHLADYMPGNSAYGYKGYMKLPNKEEEILYITADGVVDFGKTIRFKIPKRWTFIGDIQLETVVSAVTANGGGTARLVDFAGFRICEKASARYGSNQVQDVTHEDLIRLHKLYKKKNIREAEAALVGGDLSILERETLGLAAQTFLTDLPFWWTHHPSLYLNRDALSHDLEILITTPSVGDMTQGTSGTTPSLTLTSLQLRVRGIHVEDHERDDHTASTLHGAGIVSAIRDFERQFDNVIASGQTTYQIPLTGLKGLCSDFRFTVKNATQKTSPGTVSNDPYSNLAVASWEIKAGGVQIVDSRTDLQDQFYHRPRDHISDVATRMYGYSPAIDPEDLLNSTGHHNYSGFTQPTLYITFASAPVVSQVVDVWMLTYNTVQHSKAEILKNFL